jgi:hypothetical protein
MVLWVVLFVVGLLVLGGLWAGIALKNTRANGTTGRNRAKLFGEDPRVDHVNRER